MTERITAEWLAEQDLEALLDALTDELLAVPDHEILTYFDHAAGERHDAAETVRGLVAAADAELAATPASLFKTPGLRAYLARNQ